MTIRQILDELILIRPHQFAEETLRLWITRLDHMVWHEVIQSHEVPEELTYAAMKEVYETNTGNHLDDDAFEGIDLFPLYTALSEGPSTTYDWTVQICYPSANAKPLVQEPYGTDIYLYWLLARMDKVNGETERYNQDITLFQSTYNMFTTWYHRYKKYNAPPERFTIAVGG